MRFKTKGSYEALLKARLDSIVSKKGKGKGTLIKAKSLNGLDILNYTSSCLYKAKWNDEEVNQYVRLATERGGDFLMKVSSSLLEIEESIWTI